MEADIEQKGIKQQFEQSKTLGEFWKSIKLSTIYDSASDMVKNGYEKFMNARKNAKMTGKMLAHYLASQNELFKG